MLQIVQGSGVAAGPSEAGALAPAAEQLAERAPLRLVENRPSSILLAGGDASSRSALLHELSELLPAGTCFQEAEARWEVLERAPTSRMVMLAGDVEGSSPESVIDLIGSRHPRLPVVKLGAGASA